jgi:hypothetical protein
VLAPREARIRAQDVGQVGEHHPLAGERAQGGGVARRVPATLAMLHAATSVLGFCSFVLMQRSSASAVEGAWAQYPVRLADHG